MSELVDHADYDSGKIFLLGGIKKENCSSKGMKSIFRDRAKNHVSDAVDHADYDSGKIFLFGGIKKR